MMVVVELTEGKVIKVGQVYSQEVEMFNTLRNCVGLHPINEHLFAITNQLEENRTLHFMFYHLQPKCPAIFPYEARSQTVQLQLSDQPMIIKCLKERE